MASTKIRGITIELNADTSGISKGLKSVNSEIKSTQSQLRDVERLLKLDPTNTQLLAQKQRLLKDAVSETTTKLDTLKKAQEEVGKTLKETGEGQQQYDALTREIVSCEQELKKAEKAASGFNVTAAKISATADKMASGLSNAADKTRGLSMAAGGVLAALGGAAYKAAQSADDLNTLAKQTGFTTAELQKMQYAADRIDVPMETITSAAAKMTKQLANNEEKFAALGVETRNADGSFRDVNEIFNATVEALSQIPNETERDSAAMEIF
jgi:chromosome segregation ATPase